MAGVTLHFPYDSMSPTSSGRERAGLLVAGVITPAGGLAVGGSFGARGIALTVAYAWIWVSDYTGRQEDR